MVEFKVKEHTYRNKESDSYYTSVTTVIKKFKPEFDSKGISEKYAIKHPEKTAEEWRDTWKEISQESMDYGTKIHAELEAKTKQQDDCRVASHEIDSDTIRSIDSLKDLEPGIYPELLLWNNKYNIAGQADIVKVRKDGKTVDIADYKTYRKVELKSFYNPKLKGYKMMLEPLQGVQNCNYSHAALQLSTYAVILEELGYKIGTLELIHVTRDGDHIPYNVPYFKYKMFVMFMLMYFNTNKKK